MGKTRKFNPEFKRNAVQLAELPGVPVAQVADDLGIGESLLRRWIARYGTASPEPAADKASCAKGSDLVTLRIARKQDP